MKVKKEDLFREFNKGISLDERAYSGYIPGTRIQAFISALSENFDEFQGLVERIERENNDRRWHISIGVRVLFELIRATFRLNSGDLIEVLNNEKNAGLLSVVRKFDNYAYLSRQEWSNRKPIFDKYQDELECLAWKVKDSYHAAIREREPLAYLELCGALKRRVPLDESKFLEMINFTRYYPDQLLEWSNHYPDDLVLKAFFFQKITMIPSVPLLGKVINSRSELEGCSVPVTGMGLGFYTRYPKIDKLYRFQRALETRLLLQILDDNMELLIRESIVDPAVLIGDSTSLRARKDDQDAVKYHSNDSEAARVMKYQAICDSNAIPLVLVTRNGNENDKKGFRSLEDGLRKVHEVAAKHGKKIEHVILDSGYQSDRVIDFVEQELEAIPLIDINPGRSKYLGLIKKRLDHLKRLYDSLQEKKAGNTPVGSTASFWFYVEVQEFEEWLGNINGIRPGRVTKTIEILLELGIINFIKLYRKRPVIEGLFGLMKSCHALLGRADRRLPVKGKKNIQVHGMLTIIALQFKAYFNYLVLGHSGHYLRSLYSIKLSELTLYY